MTKLPPKGWPTSGWQNLKQNKIKSAIYIAVFVLFASAIFYFRGYLSAIFTSPDAVRDWVLGYGTFAPLALFFLQIVQVIIAPLNDFLINFAGGYLFGPYLGFLYNYFGWTIGAIIVFWLARLFGRGFLNLFISKEKFLKYDEVVSRATGIIFLLFLLPGPPDDLLVYLIGFSRSMKFRTFFWIIIISKIPGKLATSFLGAGISQHSFFSVIIYILFIAVSVIIFWKKPELWRITRGNLPL